MTEQEALTFVETFLHSANPKQRLNDLQSSVFMGTWAGCSYKDIVEKLDYRYEHDHIKKVGSQLWQSLSKILGERVTKGNLQSVFRRYQQSQTIRGSASVPALSPFQDLGEALDVDKLLSVLANAEVVAEVLPKEPLRKLLEALESLKERSLIPK